MYLSLIFLLFILFYLKEAHKEEGSGGNALQDGHNQRLSLLLRFNPLVGKVMFGLEKNILAFSCTLYYKAWYGNAYNENFSYSRYCKSIYNSTWQGKEKAAKTRNVNILDKVSAYFRIWMFVDFLDFGTF